MSTVAMCGEIRFGANQTRGAVLVRRFYEVTIETSKETLTDTCKITLPRKVNDYDRNKVSEVFKEGDSVEVWLGYNGELKCEFSGYILRSPVGVPLVIEFEDEMYQLKRKNISISKQNCTLKELLQTIAVGYEIKCDDTMLLGTVRYTNMSASGILDKLKEVGLKSWFDGKVLHCLSKTDTESEQIDIVLEKTAGESLSQKAIENTLVTINLLRKIGKKKVVTYGEQEAGVRISRTISGITMTDNELLDEAKKIYLQAKKGGLDGDITLFGIPSVKHGYKMNLKSVVYPEKNGVYYIDSVRKTFTKQGYRQVCKMGNSIDNK